MRPVTLPDAETTVAVPRVRRSGIKRLWASPIACIAIGWLLVVLIASLGAPLLAPHGPLTADLSNAGAGPSAAHLLGTDGLGRDVLSRLMYGGVDALIGVAICVAVAALLGVLTGVIAGYGGGWSDTIFSLFANTALTMPGIVLMLMAIAIFGSAVWVGMVTIGVLLSAGFFRLARTGTLAAKGDLYVDASRVAGVRPFAIALRHVLPNIGRPLVVQASLTATVALLLQAGIAFLGQGPPPPSPQWGSMVKEATDLMFRFPWLMVPPGVVIALTGLAFNFIGDALTDRPSGGDTHAPVMQRRRRRGATRGAPVVPETDALLSLRDVTVSFPRGDDRLVVIEGVGFDVHEGEVVALVGESGCGKTMTAHAILGLLPGDGKVTAGQILFGEHDLAAADPATLSRLRGSRIGLVSQEPIASLDPSFTVGSQIAEPLRRHLGMSRRQATERAVELLGLVEIARPAAVARSYPHQLSGGMAQRVAIAIALASEPELLIADEATTALDVTVQAEILDLLRSLQARTGIAILLVTHDWGIVADLATRAVVMYAGEVVEDSPVEQIFTRAIHPYTAGLLRSMPRAEDAGGELPTIEGTVPPPGTWPIGCRFQNRCSLSVDECRREPIALKEIESRRRSRCVRVEELLKGIS
jgi:peptide/nickel transport system permease protein